MASLVPSQAKKKFIVGKKELNRRNNLGFEVGLQRSANQRNQETKELRSLAAAVASEEGELAILQVNISLSFPDDASDLRVSTDAWLDDDVLVKGGLDSSRQRAPIEGQLEETAAATVEPDSSEPNNISPDSIGLPPLEAQTPADEAGVVLPLPTPDAMDTAMAASMGVNISTPVSMEIDDSANANAPITTEKVHSAAKLLSYFSQLAFKGLLKALDDSNPDKSKDILVPESVKSHASLTRFDVDNEGVYSHTAGTIPQRTEPILRQGASDKVKAKALNFQPEKLFFGFYKEREVDEDGSKVKKAIPVDENELVKRNLERATANAISFVSDSVSKGMNYAFIGRKPLKCNRENSTSDILFFVDLGEPGIRQFNFELATKA